jgi:hypothetical protein
MINMVMNIKGIQRVLFMSASLMGLSLVAAGSAVYAGFGISPGGIFNDHLKPGAHVEQQITVSRSDPDEELIAVIEPDLGEMNEWFTFVPGREFVLPQGQQQVSITAIIDVPEDVEFKQYKGFLRVKAAPRQQPLGVSIVKGARLEVGLVASEFDVRQLLVRMISANEPKVNEPLELLMRIENTGNTDIAPTQVKIDFYDLGDSLISSITESDLDVVPAYEIEDVVTRVLHDLPAGEYFADVRVFLGEEVLREERIVVNVDGPVPTPDVKKSAGMTTVGERCEDQGLLAGLVNNKPFYMLLMAVFVGFLLVGWFMERRKTESKAKQPGQYKAVTYSVAGFALVITFVYFGLLAQDEYQVIKTVPCTNEVTTLIVKTQEIAVQKTPELPSVLGTQTGESEYEVKEVTPAPVDPLTVKNPQYVSKYNVYALPDQESQVIQSMDAGSVLNVIDENSKWYKVKLENGLEGWLPKASVSSVQ